ncbi:MAG: 3-hydroxyacyl-CoA dehydrogenase NAD-binding domain-containing protein, partial [Pseudomonadota bacterium]|nr:3-hydroxyacyl-CoA dehydrogenase NAD-binding domain-containing protein [Pseudomonadota bacterium]
MSIQRVAIIGAGQMGSGIAHVFALAGYDVL